MAERSRDDIDLLATFSDETRRALYDFVAAASGPVSRDQASDAVGVSRQTAAYHLDRLAEDGLLTTEFRRLTGRSGPGAGRPAKLYRRSDRTLSVSIPPRRYELAARILLEAVGASGVDQESLSESARRYGFALGEGGLARALTDLGYEPVAEDGETRFRNCPFHALREQDMDTTCHLNLALVEGVVSGSNSKQKAVLAPEEGYCCVRIRPPVT
jgi:predicted ArsR family transcriptional regulator